MPHWFSRGLLGSCVSLGLLLAGCGDNKTGPDGLPAPAGTLVVQVDGVDAGPAAAVTVTGPGNFTRSLTTSDTLDNLAPGIYTVTATEITAGDHRWVPTPSLQPIVVTVGSQPRAQINYTIVTGGLLVVVEGLPPGVPGSLTLTGPGDFRREITGNALLAGITPGSYALNGPLLSVGASSYGPTFPTGPITVEPGILPDTALVTYVRQTGQLELVVSGLPAGISSGITITGPGGFSATTEGSGILAELDPGAYTVTAEPITHLGHTLSPVPSSQTLTLAAGATLSVGLAYTVATGALTVTVTGLPSGVDARIVVAGPGGFSKTLTETEALVGLVPGDYTVTATWVTVNGDVFRPSPPQVTLKVSSGTTPEPGWVAYAPSTGRLNVVVAGLPAGVAGNVRVSGSATSKLLTESATLTGLTPGSYSIGATIVKYAGDTYSPSPATQTAVISAGATTSTAVDYVPSAPPPPQPPPPPGTTFNLRLDGVYLTQSAQRYDSGVPLVAGRDAYLRAFVVANEPNGMAPTVRVQIFAGSVLQQTLSVPAPTSSVGNAPDESTLAGSWNVPVPGALVQPGLRIRVDVDPAELVVETDELDNVYPGSGLAKLIDVRVLPPFELRFVPVLQQVNGLQGGVTDANREDFLAGVKAMLPIAGYDADVRLPYTTTAPELQAYNANGAWGTILSELLALKSADASSRYYYGVVRTSYTSGVAGIGYIGGTARTSMGWDYLPSGLWIMAHELGHNMGRLHSPCGPVAGVDPSYPYPFAHIGIWGLNVQTLVLRQPDTHYDLMGYCHPQWISDYTLHGMITYRESGPNNVVASGSSRAQPGLLVWGRITPSGTVLEPAFAVDAPPTPVTPGSARLDLLASDGSILQTVRFAPSEVADLPTGPEETFSLVVPLNRAAQLELASLRLTAAGRVTVRQAPPDVPVAATVTRDVQGRAIVEWDAARHPMVLVRDGGTGQILSFARGGRVRLPAGIASLDLAWSDGVRTRREIRQLR